MSELFAGKPSNGNYILIELHGDMDNPIIYPPDKGWVGRGITDLDCLVCDISTNRSYVKNVYLHETGRFYITMSANEILWLDEFAIQE